MCLKREAQTTSEPTRGRHLWTKRSLGNFVFTLTLIILSLGFISCEDESNDINALLSESQPVTDDKSWNLPDTKASVGKLFQYDLGLKHHNGKYTVKEISHNSLPAWLTYNDLTDQIEGVPTADDVGEHHVAIIPVQPSSGSVKHFFTIVVKGDTSHQLTYASQVSAPSRTKQWENCRHDDPVTMAKIILDTDMSKLSGVGRATILNKITNHLTINSDLLHLHPLGDEPAYDKSALVAGPGNTQDRKYPGAVLSWQIGCGSVDAENMAILEKVESSARDGSMSNAIGHPIVGWSVTNNRPQQVTLSRKKRAVQPTAVLETSPPTKVRDNKNDQDDYFGGTDDGYSRIVPNMASPQQNRHPKRTKTAGRHMHKKSRRPKQNKSPMATAVMTPVVPTAVYKYTSTSRNVGVQPSSTRMVVMTPSPGQPVSRTEVIIQPSMPRQKPTSTTSYTAPLPTPAIPTMPSYTTMPSTSSSSSSSTSSSRSKPTISSTKSDRTRPGSSKDRIRPSKPVPTQASDKNKPPIANRKAFRRVDGVYGKVLNVKIPPDTFRDPEDGEMRNLKLLLIRDQMTVPRTHWLQLKKQVLQGILFPPVGGRPRKKEIMYEIAAIDSGNKIARTQLQVVMKKPANYNRINHEFTIAIDFDYNIFRDNPINTITVASKIAKVYGDTTPNNILITKLESGSVLFSWTNTSVRVAPCPEREIMRLISHIITDKQRMNQTFVDIMRPYRIKMAGARPLGSCRDKNFQTDSVDHDNVGTVFVRPIDKNSPPYQTPETGETGDEDKDSRDTSDNNMMITTVVPAVAIAGMILLAAIIACIFYRKRRKGKLSDEDKHTFVNKGIPVIFADELEDKPDPPTKPLIMPEEKPPLPPPVYHRTGSIPPSPPSDHKDPLESTEDERDDDRDNSPPYQPPPPFMSGNDYRQQKPRQVQLHRSPPPYVPP